MGKHTEWKAAVDDELVLCHLGTADFYETPKAAVKDLCLWHQEVGAYFAKEDAKVKRSRLVEALREMLAVQYDGDTISGEHAYWTGGTRFRPLRTQAEREKQALNEDLLGILPFCEYDGPDIKELTDILYAQGCRKPAEEAGREELQKLLCRDGFVDDIDGGLLANAILSTYNVTKKGE